MIKKGMVLRFIFVDKSGTWGRNIHVGMTYQWAKDVGFSPEEARTIAFADWLVDLQKPYNRAQHLNMNWVWFINGTTQTQYAQKCLTRAMKYRDLIALGKGLHSVQDEIAHGWIPYSGLHFSEIIGVNPDQSYGWGRREVTEAATKEYLTKYRVKRKLENLLGEM